MYRYEESSDGKEYCDEKGNWHVKKSVIEEESRQFMQHERAYSASQYHISPEILEHYRKLGEHYNSTGKVTDLK